MVRDDYGFVYDFINHMEGLGSKNYREKWRIEHKGCFPM